MPYHDQWANAAWAGKLADAEVIVACLVADITSQRQDVQRTCRKRQYGRSVYRLAKEAACHTQPKLLAVTCSWTTHHILKIDLVKMARDAQPQEHHVQRKQNTSFLDEQHHPLFETALFERAVKHRCQPRQAALALKPSPRKLIRRSRKQ